MDILLGFLIVVMRSRSGGYYCEFGRQARPDIKPNVFKTLLRFVLEGLWIMLMHWWGNAWLFLFSGSSYIAPVIAIVLFWLVFPFIITPIMRNRIYYRHGMKSKKNWNRRVIMNAIIGAATGG